MAEQRTNPFKFGDPVDGRYYLSRPNLDDSVAHFLLHQIPVVLIGPRRFGKTSFVLHLLKKMEKAGFSCIFVDIFNITSHKDFLQQILRALTPKQQLPGRIKDWFKTIFKMRPKVQMNLDELNGHPSLSFTLEKSSDADVKDMIQDVLAGLDKLSDKLIIAFDEFQKITEINDQGWLEATLRTHMQRLGRTSFLFTGSRRNIIYDMLNNHSRPMYRSCQTIEFPSFGEEFTDWVVKKFLDIGIECERQAIEELRGLVRNTPNYIQMVCFHLVAEGVCHVTRKKVIETLKTVVRQNAYAYQTLLNSLTLTQQRALRLAAVEGKQVFAKDLLAKYEIASGPALAGAIKALKDKGILDEEATGKGHVIFDDPLFAIWLRTSFGQTF